MSTQLFLGFTAGIYLTTGSIPQNLLVLNGVSAFFEFMLSYPYYYLAMYLTLGTVGSYHLLNTMYAKPKINDDKEAEEDQEEQEEEEEQEDADEEQDDAEEEQEEQEEQEVEADTEADTEAEAGAEAETETDEETIPLEDMDVDTPIALPPSPHEIYEPLFQVINA